MHPLPTESAYVELKSERVQAPDPGRFAAARASLCAGEITPPTEDWQCLAGPDEGGGGGVGGVGRCSLTLSNPR